MRGRRRDTQGKTDIYLLVYADGTSTARVHATKPPIYF